MKRKYPKWIDEYTGSIQRLFQGMDLRTLEPLDCFHFHPLYSDLWLEYIHQAISKFKEKKLPFSQAAKTLPNPSSVRAVIEFLVMHYNNLVKDKKEIDKKKIRKIFDFFVRVLRAKNKKDIFAFQENIGHSEKEIKSLIKKIKWQKGTPEISRSLGKLYLGASSLINGLMSDWCTDNGIEIWGPYDLSKDYGTDTILVIREFPRLKPVNLWPQAKKYKYKEIKIYTIYQKVKLRIEFVGCHSVFNGNLVKNLLHYALTVDGKFVSRLKEIEMLSCYLIKLAQVQYRRVKKLNFEALKQKIITQEFYQLKDFFQLVGVDFKPPSLFKQRLKGKKLLKGRYPLKTTKMPLKEVNRHFGIDNLKRLYLFKN